MYLDPSFGGEIKLMLLLERYVIGVCVDYLWTIWSIYLESYSSLVLFYLSIMFKYLGMSKNFIVCLRTSGFSSFTHNKRCNPTTSEWRNFVINERTISLLIHIDKNYISHFSTWARFKFWVYDRSASMLITCATSARQLA